MHFSQPLPYLTGDLPGTAGRIKQSPDDFRVEELPLYEPSGQGTHTYLCIEKSGLTTHAAIERIAKALGKRPRDIGYAGLKDAQAVTQQVLSVEHVDAQRVRDLALPKIRIMSVDSHTNKLKLGHLRGNRFVLKLRGISEDASEAARAIVGVLALRGVPNYFGEQRFGAAGTNAEIGLAVLQRDFRRAVHLVVGHPDDHDRDDVRCARELFAAGQFEKASRNWPYPLREHRRACQSLIRAPDDFEKAWLAVPHNLRRLYVAALQSELFNQVLAQRVEHIDRIMVGDMAWKHVNRACFRVEDAALEQPRCEAFEISPSGPLFGNKTTLASAQPGKLEEEVLDRAGLSSNDFACGSSMNLRGARRPLRVPLSGAELHEGQDDRGCYLELCFALPPGSYATSVMREICKNAGAMDVGNGESG